MEEIQADFPSKEASSPILETTTRFINGAIFNSNSMGSNNIIVFL